MNQPDLGIKVSELRQQKGMTQEHLSECCQVSSRTIQRIESGEVDPRTHTIECLSTALDFDFGGQGAANEDLWLAVLHLSSMICIPLIPLLLWTWKRDQSYKINQQGRPVLNFQITMAITLFAAAFLLMIVPFLLAFLPVDGAYLTLLIFLVPIPLIFIGIYCTYQAVVNVIRALSDKPIHYAPSIPFVK